ncbi:hypothetical protein BH23VER1_BH23VER1_11930 [soil metagenome]
MTAASALSTTVKVARLPRRSPAGGSDTDARAGVAPAGAADALPELSESTEDAGAGTGSEVRPRPS